MIAEHVGQGRAAAETVRAEALLAAGFAALLSLSQRRLSTPARALRRRTASVTGTVELTDGTREPLTAEALLAAPEGALKALNVSVVALAAALLVLRLG